jgi:hypothetical protein
MICFNQRTGITHSVPARSSCVLRPPLSLRRRCFLTLDSTAFAEYQRARDKGEPQQSSEFTGLDGSPNRWFIPLLGPAHVSSCPSVHPDDFSLLDKERNLDGFARLEFRRFLDVVGAIPTDSCGRFNDFQHHRRR